MMRASHAAWPVALGVLATAGCAAGARPSAQQAGRGWHVAYDGYGTVRVGRRAITLRPAAPAGPTSTHAALVLSGGNWRNLVAEVRVRTARQLRKPHPNPWEVGWLLWHYASGTRFYYLALKPNGWEVGKEDPGYPGNQRYLATGARPRFPPGHWYLIVVRQVGPVIGIWVDGKRLVRLADTQQPYLSGRVGLYAEDAYATFRLVSIHSR